MSTEGDSMKIGKWLAIALAAILGLGLASCGGDDEDDGETASAERYCALAAELEASAEEHYAGLDENTTQAEFAQAHVEFIDQNQATITELPDATPEEIRGDVETVLEGMRAEAGEEVEVEPAEIETADQRVREFERENC